MTAVMETRQEALVGAELAAQVAQLAKDVQPVLYERGVVHTSLDDFSECMPEGAALLVKNEGEQPTGAFKIRGATAALYLGCRAAEERGEAIGGVVTASDGNHGQGVRAAATRLGLPCAVEMAAAISSERKQRLRDAGAAVYDGHPTFEAANAAAIRRGQRDRNCLYIDPFDAVETMAGQASVAREALHDLFEAHKRGEIDLYSDDITFVVAVAGGGLTASFASVLEDARAQGLIGDNIGLIGAQLENSDAFARSWYGEEPLTEETLDRTCESTALLKAGEKTMAILQAADCFDGVMRVTRAETGEAMLRMQERYGLTEPAGALGFAAALKLAREEQHGVFLANSGRRRLFVTVRCGSDQLTEAEFQAYAGEVDASTKAAILGPSIEAEQEAEAEPAATDDSKITLRVGSVAVWSGPTHKFARGLVEPIPRAKRTAQ